MNTDRKLTQSIAVIALITGLILLIPLVLTLLGSGVDGEGFHWTLGDFVVMGALLFGTGLAIDFATRKLASPVYRAIVVAVIVLTFFLIWADLAVGIFNISGISGS